MKSRVIDLLKGKFLISDDSFKNWRFIFFVSVLAVIMISSAHYADKKVHQLAAVNKQVLELRSEFVAIRAKVQQQKLESFVKGEVLSSGLKVSEEPPKKIIVFNNNK